MNAIKDAQGFIQKHPADMSARTLAQLVQALESEAVFSISDIYALDIDRFNLAIEILREWRLDRYYAGKSKLFDISMQASELHFENQ